MAHQMGEFVNPMCETVGLSDSERQTYADLGVDDRTIRRAYTALRFLSMQALVGKDVVSQKKTLRTLIQQLNAHVKTDFEGVRSNENGGGVE